MKKKGVVVVLACVMVLAGLGFTSTAQAAYAWTPLTSFQVGYVFGMAVISDTSTNQQGSGNYYVMDPNNLNALLASALTAKTQGNVLAYIDNTVNGSICYGINIP